MPPLPSLLLQVRVAAGEAVEVGAHKLLLTAETQKEAVPDVEPTPTQVSAMHEAPAAADALSKAKKGKPVDEVEDAPRTVPWTFLELAQQPTLDVHDVVEFDAAPKATSLTTRASPWTCFVEAAHKMLGCSA